MKRVLAVAVALTVVAAACGGSEPDVISLGASFGNNETAADSSAPTGSRLSMAPSVDVVLADGLDRPAARAHAWRVTAATDTTSRLKGLADAFAVSGRPVTSPDGSVTIGTDRKVSSWSWGGVVSWAYDSGVMSGGGAVSPGCDPSVERCDQSVSPPESIAPPTDLISTADALVKARRILGAADYPVDQTALEAGSSDWSTWVDVEILTGGVRSGLIGRLDFGAAGAVTSAYGQFVSLERADEYPLVDLETAVDRMGSPMFAMSAARDIASSSDDTVPSTPTTVTVTGVDLVLQQVAVTDNESLLVPSYEFESADGVVGLVFAVEDKYLDTGTDSIEPVPGTAVPEPGAEPGIEPAPDDMVPIAQSDADSLVGLAEDEAVKVAESRRWTVRVAERDGEQFMLTADFQTNRVNLTVTDGRVTAVSVG